MRVFILGDSTAMSYTERDAPKAGWGQYLQSHFLPGAEVINHAIGGRSTKSFISEGRLLLVEEALAPGDWALIQFGHNDNVSTLVWRRTHPETSFYNNLLLMACAVTRRGAHPVLVTPICQRVFAQDGTIEDTFPGYARAIRELAKAESFPLLDMRERTMELLNTMKAEESAKLYMHLPPGIWPSWPDGLQDNTHTRAEGAEIYAALLAQCVRDSGLPLAGWLKEERA